MAIKRRQFIKLTSLTAASIPFLSWHTKTQYGLVNGNSLADDDNLFEMFVNPKNFHRPFVRWWWNGDRVTKEEVLRELDVMKDAGMVALK